MLMERVAGKQGKDAATGWIKEINQIRKGWAHPIRSKYIPMEPGTKERVLDVRRRLLAACEALNINAGVKQEQKIGAMGTASQVKDETTRD